MFWFGQESKKLAKKIAYEIPLPSSAKPPTPNLKSSPGQTPSI
jgi:hypothetical protein